MFGDVLILFSTFPLQPLLHWWHDKFDTKPNLASDTNLHAQEVLYSEVQEASRAPSYQGQQQGNARRVSSQIGSTSRRSSGQHGQPDITRRRPSGESFLGPSGSSQEHFSRHEIWYPPPSSFHDDADAPPSHCLDGNTVVNSSLPDQESGSEESARAREEMEEWRKYPPFPSAYPPTPLVPSRSRLPPNDIPKIPSHTPAIPEDPLDRFPHPEPESEQNIREREELEEWRKYPPFPSAYPPTPIAPVSRFPTSNGTADNMEFSVDRHSFPSIPENSVQDFRSSLQPRREPLDPRSSDMNDDMGIHRPDQHVRDEGEEDAEEDDDTSVTIDVGEGEDDEEDAFNITLGTPLPPSGPRGHRSRTQTRSRSRDAVSIPIAIVGSSSSSSEVSVPSSSSRLTTNHAGSTLRTRTSSESMSISDTSSLAGQKRSFPLVDVKARARAVNGQAQRGRTAQSRITSSRALVISGDDDNSSSSSSSGLDTDDNGEVSDRMPPNKKKRKVAAAPAAGPPLHSMRVTRSRGSREPPARPSLTLKTKKPLSEAPPPLSTRQRPVADGRQPLPSRASSRLRTGLPPSSDVSHGSLSSVPSASLPPRRANGRNSHK